MDRFPFATNGAASSVISVSRRNQRSVLQPFDEIQEPIDLLRLHKISN